MPLTTTHRIVKARIGWRCYSRVGDSTEYPAFAFTRAGIHRKVKGRTRRLYAAFPGATITTNVEENHA